MIVKEDGRQYIQRKRWEEHEGSGTQSWLIGVCGNSLLIALVMKWKVVLEAWEQRRKYETVLEERRSEWNQNAGGVMAIKSWLWI